MSSRTPRFSLIEVNSYFFLSSYPSLSGQCSFTATVERYTDAYIPIGPHNCLLDYLIVTTDATGPQYQLLNNGLPILGETNNFHQVMLLGTYSLSIFDGSCADTFGLEVFSDPGPAFSLTADSLICPDQSILITATYDTTAY